MTRMTTGDDRLKGLRDPGAFRRWNDEMSRKYDPDSYHRDSHPLVRRLETRRVRRLLTLLQVESGQTVLEVGCGAGNILERVRSDARLFGVDLSRGLLSKAQKALGSRAVLLESFAESLPFRDASFDRVYCSEVLEHVVDPFVVLREIRRVIRDTGRVAISFPNEDLIDRFKSVAC